MYYILWTYDRLKPKLPNRLLCALNSVLFQLKLPQCVLRWTFYLSFHTCYQMSAAGFYMLFVLISESLTLFYKTGEKLVIHFWCNHCISYWRIMVILSKTGCLWRSSHGRKCCFRVFERYFYLMLELVSLTGEMQIRMIYALVLAWWYEEMYPLLFCFAVSSSPRVFSVYLRSRHC